MASNQSSSSGFVDNWQGGKTLAECNLRMFEKEDACDVTFRCGTDGHVIKSHRFVLMSRSCVFHAMFCGGFEQTSDIAIPDVDFASFKQFLVYLYTDYTSVSAENVTALLYCAKKYAVTGLEKMCLDYLGQHLTVNNACTILQAADRFDEKELFEKALSLIMSDGDNALKSNDFLTLSSNLVDQIVESDDLNADEQVIFTAVNSWAEAECDRQGKEVASDSKRSVLGETLNKIRFPLLQPAFISNEVKCSGLLTDAERVGVLDYIKGSFTPRILYLRPTAIDCDRRSQSIAVPYGECWPIFSKFRLHRNVFATLLRSKRKQNQIS